MYNSMCMHTGNKGKSHQSLDQVDDSLIEGVVGALTGHLQHTLHELLGICLHHAAQLSACSQEFCAMAPGLRCGEAFRLTGLRAFCYLFMGYNNAMKSLSRSRG